MEYKYLCYILKGGKLMKRISSILLMLLIFAMLFPFISVNAASLTGITGTKLNDQINFKLDGNVVVPVGDDGTPVLPISYNGTTYLPVRAIGYLLGLGIGYDNPTKTVLISSRSDKTGPKAITTFKTGQLTPITGAVLNGELKFKLDGNAVIPVGDDGTPVLPISYNGTTYLPVRAIGYLLGLGIGYDNPTKTVLITRGGNGGNNNVSTGPGWYFTHYTTAGESRIGEPHPLMGTSSYMYDEYKSDGGKNDLTITHNRYDYDKGDLLVGVTYRVIWTDPPEYMEAGSKASMDFERSTISTMGVWKAADISANWNQGWTVYFVGSDGTKYIQKDMKIKMTMEKEVTKEIPGSVKRIQVILGEGWSYEYHYEWRD